MSLPLEPEDFGCFPARNEPAAIHGAQPVELLRLVHVSGRDDHAHARTARTHVADQVPELPAGKRIDTRGGLVKDQEVGIMDQGTA